MSRRPTVALALALLLLLGACGQQDAGPDDPGGAISAPTVEQTVPSDGATGVFLNSNISVTFSDPMARSPTEAAFGATPSVDCAFAWSGETRMICETQSDLIANQGYSVTIDTGAEDSDGDALAAAETFSFTTGSIAAPECTFGSTEFGACVLAP